MNKIALHKSCICTSPANKFVANTSGSRKKVEYWFVWKFVPIFKNIEQGLLGYISCWTRLKPLVWSKYSTFIFTSASGVLGSFVGINTVLVNLPCGSSWKFGSNTTLIVASSFGSMLFEEIVADVQLQLVVNSPISTVSNRLFVLPALLNFLSVSFSLWFSIAL